MVTIHHLPSELLDAVMAKLARSPPEQSASHVQGMEGYLARLARSTPEESTPEEHVSSGQGFKALRNARLVCRNWNRAASMHLFRILHLRHGPPPYGANDRLRDDSREEYYDTELLMYAMEDDHRAIFDDWHQTLDLDVARRAARQVIIDTTPPEIPRDILLYFWQEWGKTADAEFMGFNDALSRIAELPNLEAVEIHFHDKCVGEENEGQDWRQDHEPRMARRNALKAVFRAIHKRKLKSAADGQVQHRRTITHLALKNLQNVTDTEFENSSLFQSVIEDIKHLHLHIAAEHNEDEPEKSFLAVERLNFEPQLQSGLLSSVAGQLTTLTLSFREEWGTMPGYFDGSGLDFPNLRTLHLRFFAISHNNHLDWVLRMPALKSLCLTQTRIMTHAIIHGRHLDGWNLQTHDWERLPQNTDDFEDESPIFTYAGRWSYFFDRLRLELEGLEDFRISWFDGWYDSAGCPWTQLPKADTTAEMWPHRYMCYENRPWPLWSKKIMLGSGFSDPGEEIPPDIRTTDPPMLCFFLARKHKENDNKALQALLEATWARRS